MALNDQTTTINGRTVHYLEAGEPHKRSLLLLHGGFGDARLHWSGVMPLLSDEYYLLAPDLPGFGASEPLPDMTIESLMQWTIDFLKTLGIEQAGVIGNSFGGLIARLLAANYPTLVPVVVLVNGGVIPNVAPVAALVARIPVINNLVFKQVGKSMTSRGSLKDSVHNKDVLTDDWVKTVHDNADGLSNIMRAITTSAVPSQKTPRVPVLILWGEEDKSASVKVGESIHRNIPGSQFSAIAECGQMPHAEEPDVFLWQVRNFLQAL